MPICQICEHYEAVVDGRTKRGPWAYMCAECHTAQGGRMGVGSATLLRQEMFA